MDEMILMEALSECLEALRRGDSDLEACLDRHAGYRSELEALLDIVKLIPPRTREIAPAPSFRQRARRLILENPQSEDSTEWGWQNPR